MNVEPSVPRSRRAMLLGALGGLAGLFGSRLARPEPTAAAAGDNLVIGEQNFGGSSATRLSTTSSGGALWMIQNGNGSGIRADSTNGHGGVFTTANADRYAIDAANNAAVGGSGAAIRARGGSHTGVFADSDGYGLHGSGSTGVFGAGNTGVSAVGVQYGVYGSATSYGVVGSATTYAGYFFGAVHVAGTLTKSGGAFRIDHPLDPANRYLQHSFVESPEMKNVYDGVATLNEHGEATIDLPAWFDALNDDTRIQLTPIGEHSPLFAPGEVVDGRFAIAGGRPGQRVFWQVTGVRRDAYAAANRIEVEVPKSRADRGRYLHPELHGADDAHRIGPGPNPAAR